MMEIYKLKDEIKKEVTPESVKLTITDLRQGVKNPNRVNVFVNEKYTFSLDITQVVDLKLKIGRTLTEEELEECKKASEFGKTYQRALEWVLVRPRSERELRDYLRRREQKQMMEEKKREWQDEREGKPKRRSNKAKYNFDEVIIERLMNKGYVNDRKFAEYYVENRFTKKGISRRRLEQELIKKGVTKSIIEEVLADSERNDEAEIKKIIARKREKYTEDKLINYLCRQGFSYQQVQNLVHEFEMD